MALEHMIITYNEIHRDESCSDQERNLDRLSLEGWKLHSFSDRNIPDDPLDRFDRTYILVKEVPESLEKSNQQYDYETALYGMD